MDKDFQQEVLAAKQPVLVDFWAPWCGPCVAVSAVLEELAKELKDKIKIFKVDVGDSKNQKLASQYAVQSIPNLKIFKNGKIVKEFVGLQSKEVLKKELLAV